MSSEDIQYSPLNDFHQELGAKMIPFAGWSMPVQYTSIMDEHNAVREKVGIFDISHMGQFFVSGENAAQWLNALLTNNVMEVAVGGGQYTLMLNEAGGVIDDLILYRSGETEFFLVVNASKIEEDFDWVSSHLIDGISLENKSNDWAGMAVQGPDSSATFSTLFPNETLPARNGIQFIKSGEEQLLVCRTGYTGEDGFEFFSSANQGAKWFQKFMDAGAQPCGLGARDTLRLEVCYPLNGNDLSAERTPIAAGLGFFCDLEKEFNGADVLRKQKEEGLSEKLVAIKYTGKGAPPRAHYKVLSVEKEEIGELSSGALSPTLKEGIAMAYLPKGYAKLGTPLFIDVRGRQFEAKVVKKPFYKKP